MDPAAPPNPAAAAVAVAVAVAVAAPTNVVIPIRIPDSLMHKNRLQEYTQRSSISLPVYRTVNEGLPHAPMFKSTVTVDGTDYTSVNTFSQRKEAEQDVARLALQSISRNIQDQGCPLLHQDVIFCKSILNEFAAKMRFEMPNYTTNQTEGILPVFVSSLVFNGKLYTGPAGRNKKEAEQLAARTVIQTILANHGAGTCLSQIIKSKTKLYAALHKIRNSGLDQGSGLVQDSSLAQDAVLVQPTGLIQQTDVPVGVNPGNSDNNPGITQNKRKDASENLSHVHIFRKPKKEQCDCVISTGPIEFVPAVPDQPANGCPATLASNTSGPLSNALLMTQNQAMMPPKKNKKRKPKKPKCDQSQTAAVPISQAPSCSVAL